MSVVLFYLLLYGTWVVLLTRISGEWNRQDRRRFVVLFAAIGWTAFGLIYAVLRRVQVSRRQRQAV